MVGCVGWLNWIIDTLLRWSKCLSVRPFVRSSVSPAFSLRVCFGLLYTDASFLLTHHRTAVHVILFGVLSYLNRQTSSDHLCIFHQRLCGIKDDLVFLVLVFKIERPTRL